MKYVRLLVCQLLLLVCLGAVCSATSSCTPQQAAAVLPIVKDLIVEILDAEQKLDMLDTAAEAWFARYPNAELRQTYESLSDKTRRTLNVALQSTYGVRDLSEGDAQAALTDFSAAWTELWKLATEAGFVGRGGTVSMAPGKQYVIEPPLALRRAPQP